MESRTLVCDRCARESKFTIAVEAVVIQSRTHGTFRLDLCDDHVDSLVQDLNALSVPHLVRSIIEHTLQTRAGRDVPTTELIRIVGAQRKLVAHTLQELVSEHLVKLAGKTADRTVTWVGPVSNGGPPAPVPLLRKAQKGASRHRAVEWLRAVLRERKQLGSIEVYKLGKAAGFNEGALAFARTRLRDLKELRLRGTRSRATYIYAGE